MLGEGALVASVLGTSGALLYLQYLRNKVNIRRKSCGFIAGYLWSPSLSTVPQEQGKISRDNLVASGGTSGALLYLQYLRNKVK